MSEEDSRQFYDRLHCFTDFSEITRPSHYHAIPADWTVFITDVKHSTQAIRAGRYRDVNKIGAASIAAIRHTIPIEFPFVFGGDGATLVVPTRYADKVGQALLKLSHLSIQEFGLLLRVGCMAMQEIYDASHFVEVAKFELTPGQSTAAFRGGGVSFAERCIKDDATRCLTAEHNFSGCEMTGLSCRWNMIPNKRGCILSLLVMPRVRHDRVIKHFFEKLESLTGHMDDINPVNVETMDYQTVWQCIRDEKRYHSSLWNVKYLLRILEIVAAVLVFRHKVPPLFMNPQKYQQAMRIHSDYRKYDETLRMVIDCSPAVATQLQRYLEECQLAGTLYYGLHQSEQAQMTCYVESIADGGHIHFIDGGDGGYAMAAKKMKKQMACNPESSTP